MIDQRGLYDKFIVKRKDGTDNTGGKHQQCQYFVLDLTHDPCAIDALEAYADACVMERPRLSIELKELLEKLA